MTKITKLSLAAIVALSTTLNAADSKITANGDVKSWIETQAAHGAEVTDKTNSAYGAGMFSSANTAGQFVVNVGVKIEGEKATFNTRTYGWSTLGVAGDILDKTKVSDTAGQFVSEANITTDLVANTKFIAGSMQLDTPLLFTERWNAIPNTYEAVVLSNSSFKDIALTTAYVGSGNGAKGTVIASGGTFSDINKRNDKDKDGNYVNEQGGAYMIAANSKVVVPTNAYLYILPNHANAVWLDTSIKVAGANIKAIVASVGVNEGSDPTITTDDIESRTTGYAASVGYEVAGVKLFGAFSMVGKGYSALGNIGTEQKKTKLPTAGVYTDGLYVAQPDVTAFKVKASKKVANVNIIAQYISSTGGDNKEGYTTGTTKFAGKGADALTTSEIDLIAVTKLGGIDLKAMYMIRNGVENAAKTGTSINSSDVKDTTQSKLRVVATIKF